MFYFGDKIFLNHVVDFLQLHLLQNVLFWWRDLSQSYGGFSTAKSSSEGSMLVTRSFSIYLNIGVMLFNIYLSHFIFELIQILTGDGDETVSKLTMLSANSR